MATALPSVGQHAIQGAVLAVPVGQNSSGVASPTNPVPVEAYAGSGEYETVAASQTAQVLGATGATGDYCEGLLCVVATAATSAVTLLDNAISISVLPANVGAGVGTYYIPIGARSVSGAWKVTTGAGVSVFATGNFT